MENKDLKLFVAAAAFVYSVGAAAAPSALPTTSSAQSAFATPEAAVDALAAAVRAEDDAALRAILGPHGGKLVQSGDAIADQQNRRAFSRSYDEAKQIVQKSDGRAELTLGKDAWPMPIPLVKGKDGQWRFDTAAGEQEILTRRIGRNELAAIQVCLAVVDAQLEFTRRDADGDGIHEYAARFASRPGKKDGLYWPTGADEPQSPLGPLLAAAAAEGYSGTSAGSQQPYHGYLYKILTRQGTHAPGGAYNYYVKGKMLGGFALIAYPARYGASGLMSFMVNQDGTVYQKDLGKNTATLAAHWNSFDPDPSWHPVPQAK